MKTRIITLAASLLFSLTAVKAENFKTFRIYDRLGSAMEVIMKVENIQEEFDFDTKEVFEEVKNENSYVLQDITPFIKPEQEIAEELPIVNE
jgi:hypothetical protein